MAKLPGAFSQANSGEIVQAKYRVSFR